jgi:hypothetical protein
VTTGRRDNEQHNEDLSQFWDKIAISERSIVARMMQCGFIPEVVLATRVEKASECSEIYITKIDANFQSNCDWSGGPGV